MILSLVLGAAWPRGDVYVCVCGGGGGSKHGDAFVCI